MQSRSDSSDGRLRELVAGLGEEDVEWHDPPASLWESIRSEAFVGPVPETADRGRTATPIDRTDAGRPSTQGRSQMRTRVLATAAAVAVLAGVGGGLAVATRSQAPPTEVVASARLDQLEPLGSTRATAELVTEGDTTRLVLDTQDMAPAPDGQEYELWLIDPDVADPRSLGVVTGSGAVAVPTAIDPADHPIVDISLEPVDGDHRHSGHSLMRGTLQ